MKKTTIRGGQTVRVGNREARVVSCERTCDKAARRGRRTFLVRYADGTEERVPASAITTEWRA